MSSNLSQVPQSRPSPSHAQDALPTTPSTTVLTRPHSFTLGGIEIPPRCTSRPSSRYSHRRASKRRSMHSSWDPFENVHVPDPCKRPLGLSGPEPVGAYPALSGFLFTHSFPRMRCGRIAVGPPYLAKEHPRSHGLVRSTAAAISPNFCFDTKVAPAMVLIGNGQHCTNSEPIDPDRA
jgi:hypothetical protein